MVGCWLRSTMAFNGNGTEEQQAEYTEEYQTDYVVNSADYQELVGLGIDEQVARELDELFQAGKHLPSSWYLANTGCETVVFCSVYKLLNSRINMY